MEACGGAQHWARALTKIGHQFKLMSAKLVKAFNIGNKNDPAEDEIPGSKGGVHIEKFELPARAG
jgi:transposase